MRIEIGSSRPDANPTSFTVRFRRSALRGARGRTPCTKLELGAILAKPTHGAVLRPRGTTRELSARASGPKSCGPSPNPLKGARVMHDLDRTMGRTHMETEFLEFQGEG